jgi:hypothetical protein
MDRDAHVAVVRGADAKRAFEPGGQVRARRRARVCTDRLCPCRRARCDARVPKRFAREHELKRAGKEQQREREQRHELGRGLASLGGEGAKTRAESRAGVRAPWMRADASAGVRVPWMPPESRAESRAGIGVL